MKLLTVRSFSAAAALLLMASAATSQAQAAPVHNIVLVHGAFVTGHTIEVPNASHSIYESHPKEVAALIEAAAQHALDGK